VKLNDGRKLILCALENSNLEKAQRLLGELSECCKSDPLTRYLMYKTALRGQDHDLGMPFKQTKTLLLTPT
jgi:hypothetical protein